MNYGYDIRDQVDRLLYEHFDNFAEHLVMTIEARNAASTKYDLEKGLKNLNNIHTSIIPFISYLCKGVTNFGC